MDQIILAFITGFTTGGLSCLAVQGGLLASSLAAQIETDLTLQPRQTKRAVLTSSLPNRTNLALPIALFLIAKLVAYTTLGALLGLVGSFLTFDPVTRALLMITIGVFMVGNGLRMIEVHPIFRYFNFEPPKWITRYVRRTAKSSTNTITPLVLGAMTVFIPCGVTQAMMAAALGTGSPMLGAALMFSFTLGTSPLFFMMAYLTIQLGKRLEKFFMRFVAIVVILLGLLTFDNGLNLMGSPYSISGMLGSMLPASANNLSTVEEPPSGATELELKVANNGYFPATLYAIANQPISLNLVTENTYSCARDFVIPKMKYYNLLPESGQVTVEIPPQDAGTVLRFTCSMGMYTGKIVFGY